MLKKLKALFIRLVKPTVGKSLPDSTEKLNECYADLDIENHWQGDVYLKDSFVQSSLPNPNVPYWMLVNRTCHLYQGGGRSIKLPYLNFVVVTPLIEHVKKSEKSIKNTIKDLVNDKLEGFLFLPAFPDRGLDIHLVVNFNLIHSFSVENAPKPSDKIIQMSSPFCEHVFQLFTRYFYTVGYEDQTIKSNEYIQSIIEECEEQLKDK